MARVLCIESDRALRERVKALLEREGFAVDLTVSGLDGISRALSLPPDLVLADLDLPDIEGAALMARLKGERSLAGVPLVAVGGSREEHDAALAAGADGFVERGSGDALAGEVKAFLAGRRERQPEDGGAARPRALPDALAARLESAIASAQRARRRVEELGRLRSAFVRNLSHELSTPLTPLAGYLRILASGKLGALTPQQQRVVETMVQSVARLTRVVDNLADFGSLDAGEAPLLRTDVEPDQLADGVVEELGPAIREARMHATVLHAGGGPVVADGRKLRQAVANLVQNAVKFSPQGGELLVEVTREPGRVRFAVYDQGPGVPPGEAEQIFEPLYHAAARGNAAARAPGSGLGLPVARRIAEAHGGRVWVESPPRTQPAALTRLFTGSRFILEIPVGPAQTVRVGAGAPAATSA